MDFSAKYTHCRARTTSRPFALAYSHIITYLRAHSLSDVASAYILLATCPHMSLRGLYITTAYPHLHYIWPHHYYAQYYTLDYG
ncbi:hypothetical protein BDQ17DRAFT_1377895, partial [Cyathus striatus]